MEKLSSEIHFRFLLEADDEDIPHVCRMNKYYEELCKDEWFWKQRTKRKYKAFLHLRGHFSSYKTFYYALSKKALYIVLPHAQYPFGAYHLFNNIEDAYNHLRNSWQFLHPIEDSELPINEILGKSIYIIFQEKGLTIRDTDHLLFGIIPGNYHLDTNDLYVHPRLSYLPSFSTDEHYLTFIDKDYMKPYEHTIYVGKESVRFLLKIFKEAENRTLELNQFMIRYVNDPNHIETFEYWQDEKIFVRKEFPPVFITHFDDDVEFMVMPEKYYNYFSKINYNIIDINYPNLISIFKEIKDDSLWYSMKEGNLFPLQKQTSRSYRSL